MADNTMGWDEFQLNVFGPDVGQNDANFPSLFGDMPEFHDFSQHNLAPGFPQHNLPPGFQQEQQEQPQQPLPLPVISQSQPVNGRGRSKRKSMSPGVHVDANTTRRPVLHPGQVLVKASQTIEKTAQEFRGILGDEALKVQKEQGEKIADLERKLKRLMKRQKTVEVKPVPLLLEQRPNEPVPPLEASEYNMIPWIWVLKNVGIHLRMVELHELSKPGDISVRVLENLVTRVAIMVTDYKRPNTQELFSFKRYWDDQGQIVNDVNTEECWQAKVKKFFGNLSEVPLAFLRNRVRVVESHPDYENFGTGLINEQLFKAAMKALQPITKLKSKAYGVMRDGKTFKLNPEMDTSLFQIVKQPSTKDVLVTISDNWDLNLVK